ncbi:LiaI-LiaF-like domain-containing protein, partial [Deinococcus pimensis]|uniref:LiaI-LiaF-like domain-containing protein n=1 Tax=Deinococcus pimensis TaxID=309888 RepID=UPI003CCBCCB2
MRSNVLLASILIALGALFLLGEYGPGLPLDAVWAGAARAWPLVLVAIGLSLLGRGRRW